MSRLEIKENRIEGYRRSSSWAKDQIVYFSAEFSEKFAAPYYAPDKSRNYVSRNWTDTIRRKGIKVIFPFEKPKNRQLLVKVAISPVSIEGARKNLEAEIPHWDFEKVRSDAKAAWNKEFSKIEVSGGTDAQMTNFYTALYHTMIAPNIFSDVDGNYLGLDKKIYNLSERPKTKNQKPKTVFGKLHRFFTLGHISRRASALYDH